jgi:hypothetical protein
LRILPPEPEHLHAPQAVALHGLAWGGHASRRLVTIVLVVHAACLVWLCSDWQRVKLIVYDFTEVTSEAYMAQPPAALLPFGYAEDDPAGLGRFRAIAEPIVAGAAGDGEKMRRLGDYIYSMRRGSAGSDEREVREGVTVILDHMEHGEPQGCSQMSVILAAFWRSMGGHTRGIRWATVEGRLGHFAVELYSTQYDRWLYYDMNLNGYGADQEGEPLSIAALRANLLTGEGLSLHVNATTHDWSVGEFRSFLRSYPVEWYTLNNDALYMEPNRRFGAFNRLFPWLVRLPYPADRLVDNVVGQRDRRLVVDGKIQIAGLLTFSGARLLVLYLALVILLCGATLLPLRAGRASRLSVRPRPIAA